MKRYNKAHYILIPSLSLLHFFCFHLFSCKSSERKPQKSFGIVIHGGAGVIHPDEMEADQERAYKNALMTAVRTGYKILESGRSSLDAVEETIVGMENDSLFNAGRGAVFAANGKNELDASIMDGYTQNAGAITGVSRIRNPIRLARVVMDSSEHVFLSGPGAEEFAVQFGIELVDPKYFYTQRRWNQLIKAQRSNHVGTVGVVALDMNGNLAAGTSTGGMTNKRFGRIGDSPVIGAGTYADNSTCAVSATGHGEYFIKGVIAYDIAARIEFSGKSVVESAHEVIHQKLTKMGGTGGIIAIDKEGNIAMTFNTVGMFRGYWVSGKDRWIGIYGNEYYKNHE